MAGSAPGPGCPHTFWVRVWVRDDARGRAGAASGRLGPPLAVAAPMQRPRPRVRRPDRPLCVLARSNTHR